MRLKCAFLIAWFCMVALLANAQKVHHGGKSMYTKSRFNYNATKIRGAKAKVVCPIFEKSKYPYMGIGLKLGDPFALTFKYYPHKNLAFVADVGKPASALYNPFFRDRFSSIVVTDTFTLPQASLLYLTHKVKMDIVVDARVLYQFSANRISQGLQLYIGGGWEYRTTRIEYDYLYNTGETASPDEFGRFSYNRISMGPQVTFGFEYSYFEMPISAFMELEYYYDVVSDSGWTRFQGGVGLRYVF